MKLFSHKHAAILRHLSAFALVVFSGLRLTAQSAPALSTPAQSAPALSTPVQTAHSLPQLVQRGGRTALFVDGAPFLILGAQVNNSSSWPAMESQVWPALESMHVNTALMPVYWEQFEPTPGRYDTSLVDNLLAQARKRHLRLVLLWFGTWKNGSQHYMPEWAKRQPQIYTHVLDREGHPVDSPSPFATASLQADSTAFAALMRHLKAADIQRTVLMVQVENETGTWGGTHRDFSPAAQHAFDAPVPQAVLTAMHVPSSALPQSWQQAFGAEADVYFHAWAIASYVGKVAAAGKAVYPLPMYVNAALRNPLHPGPPGSYESGAPTDNVLDIWKAAAPAIDILAPDIYEDDPEAYLKVIEQYSRTDNPLFVPETGGPNARFFFTALNRQLIGLSPYGMDLTRPYAYRWAIQGRGPQPAATPPDPAAMQADFDQLMAPWAFNYKLIGPMQRQIARLNFEGKLQATAEVKGRPQQTLDLGPWKATITYGASRHNPPAGNPTPEGRVLIAQTAPDEFLVAGFFCRVDFQPAAPGLHPQFLHVEEGTYNNGVFHLLRIWNGDDTDYGLNLTSTPTVLRVSLSTY